MNDGSFAARRVTLTIAGLIALASMITVLAVSGTGESHAAGEHAHSASLPARTAKAITFHDEMRALWEAHGSWTHMVIVSSPCCCSRGRPWRT